MGLEKTLRIFQMKTESVLKMLFVFCDNRVHSINEENFRFSSQVLKGK